MTTKARIFVTIAGVALALIGVVGMTYYTAMLRAGRDTQSWTATEGVIMASGPGFCRPYLRYTYRNRHNYLFEGNVYRLTSCLTLRDIYWLIHDQYLEGAKVTVYYDPYSHGDAVLQRGAPRGAERVAFVSLPILLAGLLLIWIALRKQGYPRLDVADGGARMYGGFVLGLTSIVSVLSAITHFIHHAVGKFGPTGTWISDSITAAVMAAFLGGVLLICLKLNSWWLPAVPRRLQLITGAACGALVAGGLFLLPEEAGPIGDNFLGQLRLLAALNIPSLFVVLLIGVGSRQASLTPATSYSTQAIPG